MARDFDKKKLSAADDSATDKINSRHCAAFGCPMHGAITQSVTGGGLWLCPMHFRAHPSNWQKLTERIRQNMTLVNLINEIRGAQNGKPFDYLDWMEQTKDSELAPCDIDRRPRGTKGLSMRKWQTRIERLLFAGVMTGMDEEEVNYGQAKSSEEIMKKIEEFMKDHGV